MNRWLFIVSLIFAGLCGYWYVFLHDAPDPAKMYVFKGVHGPTVPSTLTQPDTAAIEAYTNPDPHRLAILVTDPASGWLGLVRGFKSRGVPFSVTTDPAKALQHNVVLVYPIISGKTLSGETLRALAAHVRGGGALLGFNQAGGGLEELFGAPDGVESRARNTLTWTAPAPSPQEQVIGVSHPGDAQMGTVGYPGATGEVLARYDDGAAAVVCRTVVGRACLMGVDLGALAERGMNGRGEAIGRMYVNGYEPSVDVLFRWVRDFYVGSEPMPWLISTAPPGKTASIVLTHDVDFTRSVTNTPLYADMLQKHGVKATFFVQTKYVKDWNDDIFFNDSTVPLLRGLKDAGMELATHTVAHSRDFKNFPMGDGAEAYPKYRPFVIDQVHARGGTVLGEVRVPKFLLENQTGVPVVSFRPGHLSYPPGLPQALAASGYSYSSSLPADSALTHLPYQTSFNRADTALEPIFEFPVTIEDEAPPVLSQRFDAAQQVIGAIARDHGVAVIMIHPDIAGQKLEFERRLIEAWQSRAWIGSLRDFGSWWRGRDQLATEVIQENGRWILEVHAGAVAANVDVILPKTANGTVRINLGAEQTARIPFS